MPCHCQAFRNIVQKYLNAWHAHWHFSIEKWCQNQSWTFCKQIDVNSRCGIYVQMLCWPYYMPMMYNIHIQNLRQAYINFDTELSYLSSYLRWGNCNIRTNDSSNRLLVSPILSQVNHLWFNLSTGTDFISHIDISQGRCHMIGLDWRHLGELVMIYSSSWTWL